MVGRRLRTVLRLPLTAAQWWRRTTSAPLAEQWLLLGALPGLLGLGWLLGIGDGLGFSLAADSLVADPRTVLTAFTANFIHVSARHLLNNLLNFWITLFGLYPLVAIAGWTARFRRLVVAYLLGVPFVVAWVTLGTLGQVTDQLSVGFSGVVAAFLGLLPVALAAAASEVTDGELDPAWGVVPFLGSLAIVFVTPSVWYFPAQPTLAAGCVSFAVLAALGLWWTDTPTDVRRYGQQLSADQELAFLIGLTVFGTGVAGALVIVPLGTNVWGHLTGYVAGFLVPYLGYVVVPALGSRGR